MIDKVKVDNILVKTPKMATKSARKSLIFAPVDSSSGESKEASESESTDSESVTTQLIKVLVAMKKFEAPCWCEILLYHQLMHHAL